MKKNILVPHDFSEISLRLLRHAIGKYNGEEVEIVMTHCMFLPNSIIDLLYFSKAEFIQSLETAEFRRSYQSMIKRNTHRNVSVRADVFTGLNQRAFKHFVYGNSLHEALIPNPYRHVRSHKNSFDPLPFIRRSGLKITEVAIPEDRCSFDYLTELGY